jgi:hypothetical protein
MYRSSLFLDNKLMIDSQPTRFLPVHMLSLDEYCPEYKLATMERVNE